MDEYHNIDFIRLSHKELQRTCKELGLPARNTSEYLAASLISYFQATREKSGVPSEVLPQSAPIEVSNLDTQLNAGGSRNEIVEAPEKRVEDVNTNVYGTSPLLGSMCSDGKLSQTIYYRAEGTFPDLVSAPPANMIINDPSSNGTTDAFRCSILSTREIISPPQPGSQCVISSLKPNNKELSSSNEVRSPCQASVVPGTSRPIPSFEFFVRSDEGLNLFIDLNSSTSDWVKSFNESVSIDLGNESVSPHGEFENFRDHDENNNCSILGNSPDIEAHCKETGNALRTSCFPPQNDKHDLVNSTISLPNKNGDSVCELDGSLNGPSLSACHEGGYLTDNSEGSGCLDSHGLEKVSEKSFIWESEGLGNKRKHSYSEDRHFYNILVPKDFRSSKKLDTEVYPRRSTRLVYKI